MSKKIILLGMSVLMIAFSSCNKDKPLIDETKTFVGNNWNFDQKFVVFQKQIEASEQPYEIYLDLDLEKDLDLDEFPVTVSIYSDKGEESHKQVVFYFPVVADNNLSTPNSPKILTKLVYAEKYFNTSGNYTFKLLRKSSKYDLYGIKGVRFRVVPKEVKN
jgi:hypothetical protein